MLVPTVGASFAGQRLIDAGDSICQREAENLLKEAKLEAKDPVFQARIELEKEQKAKLAEVSTTERRGCPAGRGAGSKTELLEKRSRC